MNFKNKSLENTTLTILQTICRDQEGACVNRFTSDELLSQKQKVHYQQNATQKGAILSTKFV